MGAIGLNISGLERQIFDSAFISVLGDSIGRFMTLVLVVFTSRCFAPTGSLTIRV